ncbi:hypothetical protein [Vibrio sp. OPT18]|uniref:hypothetical protein n=1 Tax=Vibrio sp. OPT18 TaxID=2778641 RepID=UPI0018811034|nr:hypothetical protein [Vibrio sp. OPT18]MBE8574123.1 hypothetical protein [Vibrio sp. OPT18]
MARNPVVHIPISKSVHQRMENYKNKIEASTMAEVGRELLEFALLIKERSEEADSRTNRELMEEILLKLCVNEELAKNNYTHVWQDGKSWNSTMVDMMKEDVSRANHKGLVKFESFMNKEEGSDK